MVEDTLNLLICVLPVVLQIDAVKKLLDISFYIRGEHEASLEFTVQSPVFTGVVIVPSCQSVLIFERKPFEILFLLLYQPSFVALIVRDIFNLQREVKMP